MTDKIVVDTAKTLRLCHSALRSDDPELVAAGESVMSALVPSLRYEQALVPAEVKKSLETLRSANPRCKVNNARKRNTNHESGV